MKSQKYLLFFALSFIIPQIYSMKEDGTAPDFNIQDEKIVNTEKRKREIFFKTIAVYKVGLNSKQSKDIQKMDHPLLEGLRVSFKGERVEPFTDGTGGLLNPILKKYSISKEAIKGSDHTGVQITIEGCVAADGIDNYMFDHTYFGRHYEDTLEVDGAIYKKANYEISRLEEVILGYLKERAVDRQISDLSETYFSEGCFARKFIDYIKHEWTSKKNEEDSGIRTQEENDLIQRHMARSTYWPSTWHSPRYVRTGEYIRKARLKGNEDPHASIELTELNISVEAPR